jgi:hypothetical protein
MSDVLLLLIRINRGNPVAHPTCAGFSTLFRGLSASARRMSGRPALRRAGTEARKNAPSLEGMWCYSG